MAQRRWRAALAAAKAGTVSRRVRRGGLEPPPCSDRAELSELWGLKRPLSARELAACLGLARLQRPGRAISRFERGEAPWPDELRLLIRLLKLLARGGNTNRIVMDPERPGCLFELEEIK